MPRGPLSVSRREAHSGGPRVDKEQGDVAARLRAVNLALRQSVDRVQAILQSIGDGIVVADENGSLQLFNRAAEELLGVGLTDSLPEEWSSTYGVFLADGRTLCPSDQLPLAQAIRGEEVHEMELVICNPRRKAPIPIRAHAMPVKDEMGRLKGGVVVFHDISERKRAEAAILRARDELETRVEERTAKLRASEAKYQDLYDNAPDMFVCVEAVTQRLIRCNRTFLSITGLGEQEVVGRSVSDLFHPDSQGEVRKAYQVFAATGTVKDIELRLQCKDGSTREVSLNVSAVRDDVDDIICGRSILRDVTDRKKAEQRIREQRAELTHVARVSTMGEMAAGLAHEINQPLAAIAAYAEGASVRLKSGGADQGELVAIVERIAADAQRAGEVIRHLRQFVRKRETDRVAVDVNDLIRKVCGFASIEAKYQQVAMQFDLAERLPLAQADAIEIQQVILNLVRNAVDAMKEVDTRDRRITIRTRTPNPRGVEVIVEDSGCGISATVREQAFEPFFTSKEDGLGMGLAISRSIVEAHGGQIRFEPVSGRGTAVRFFLPRAKEESIDGR